MYLNEKKEPMLSKEEEKIFQEETECYMCEKEFRELTSCPKCKEQFLDEDLYCFKCEKQYKESHKIREHNHFFIFHKFFYDKVKIIIRSIMEKYGYYFRRFSFFRIARLTSCSSILSG
jgi:hypothetical protein